MTSDNDSSQLQQKYHKVLEELNNLWKENMVLKEKLPNSEGSAYDERVNKIIQENQELRADHEKLIKISQKIEKKAEDRKQSLKKLFELLTQKERELESMKAGNLKEKVAEKIQNQVNSHLEIFERNFADLQTHLQQKELELQKLEEVVSRLLSRNALGLTDEQSIEELLHSQLPSLEIVSFTTKLLITVLFSCLLAR